MSRLLRSYKGRFVEPLDSTSHECPYRRKGQVPATARAHARWSSDTGAWAGSVKTPPCTRTRQRRRCHSRRTWALLRPRAGACGEPSWWLSGTCSSSSSSSLSLRTWAVVSPLRFGRRSIRSRSQPHHRTCTSAHRSPHGRSPRGTPGQKRAQPAPFAAERSMYATTAVARARNTKSAGPIQPGSAFAISNRWLIA
jgi:hypothetical protein